MRCTDRKCDSRVSAVAASACPAGCIVNGMDVTVILMARPLDWISDRCRPVPALCFLSVGRSEVLRVLSTAWT